jgi:hypothetical protein
VANPERELLMAKNAALMLLAQINVNIKERELKGISQQETKMYLDLIFKKEETDNVTELKAEQLF